MAGVELLDVDEVDVPDPALSPPDDFSGVEDFSEDDFSEPDGVSEGEPFLVVFPDSRLSVR